MISAQHTKSSRTSLGTLAPLFVAVLALTACGEVGRDASDIPLDVPTGAVAIVATSPITRQELDRWVTRDAQGEPSRRARKRALSYLIEAQWVLHEADREGIDGDVLDELVLRALNQEDPNAERGATDADRDLQARVKLAAAALRQRHGHIRESPDGRAIARYYRAHRADFRLPASRVTHVLLARTRSSALRARALLESGQGWAAVSDRFSAAPQFALGGAATEISAGAGPSEFVGAVSAAQIGRLVGPVHVPPAARGLPSSFYVFEVVGRHPARSQSLAEVKSKIRNRLTEQRSIDAVAAFERAFKRRWRARTLCAPPYLVPLCRNAPSEGQ